MKGDISIVAIVGRPLGKFMVNEGRAGCTAIELQVGADALSNDADWNEFASLMALSLKSVPIFESVKRPTSLEGTTELMKTKKHRIVRKSDKGVLGCQQESRAGWSMGLQRIGQLTVHMVTVLVTCWMTSSPLMKRQMYF